jgi:hypothetical protein
MVVLIGFNEMIKSLIKLLISITIGTISFVFLLGQARDKQTKRMLTSARKSSANKMKRKEERRKKKGETHWKPASQYTQKMIK